MRGRGALLLALLLAGCLEPYLLTDGSSVSLGQASDGGLRHARHLPVNGNGWHVGIVWQARRASYGTDELVDAIERDSGLVARSYPSSLAGIADLSRRFGGSSHWHRSHQSGRDADILYYADDAGGHVLPPPAVMVRYRPDGWSVPALGPLGIIPSRHFDTARNWALVRALLLDPAVDVQWIFVHASIRQRLLAYARSIGESRDLLERAEAILHQPSDSAAHDDHMHVRIDCAPTDLPQGCVETGPLRWLKKYEKYDGRYRAPKLPPAPDLALVGLATRPLAELALVSR